MVRRRRFSCAFAILIALTIATGCGGGSSNGASPSPNTSVTGSARFDSLPLLPRMRALSRAQSSAGVTTRSYQVTGYDPEGALAAYASVLRNGDSWANSVRAHAVGSSYRGAWVSNGNGPIATGYTLVVTAIDAPTLSGAANSPAVQMTLQLYGPHATPSTQSPGT